MAEIEGDGPVTAVDHVVVQTKSAEAAKKFYGDQLGIRLALEQHVPDWGGTQLFFRTNSMSVEVLATEKAGDDDRLWGLGAEDGRYCRDAEAFERCRYRRVRSARGTQARHQSLHRQKPCAERADLAD